MNTIGLQRSHLHPRPAARSHQCCAHVHRRQVALPAASPSAAVSQDAAAAYTALCDLIRTNGGFVHPALQLDPDTGGIIAAKDIQPPKGSLVELPLSLRFTPAAAQELLLPLLNAAGLPTMSLLDEGQQLGLALAWLRNQASTITHTQQGPNANAKWQPYVHSLSPQHNPCGWAKTVEQLEADYQSYLHCHGLDLSWWRYFVAQAQQQMEQQAAQLAARFGKALGVTAADVLWALGQVQARKVVVDNEVLLEPWSDLLRHPPANISSSSSSSRCEIHWTYGLCRTATTVVSRGTGRRVAVCHSSPSSQHAPPEAESAAAAVAAEQQGAPAPLLSAGEELWASSSSSGGGGDSTDSTPVGGLFSSFIQEQGHLAPLVWYLQHGVVPGGLAEVAMRTSDVLASWCLTIASEAAQGSTGTNTDSSSSSSSDSKPTVLWDYLTQQYQQDCMTVLSATPPEHQRPLLQFLLQPMTAALAPAEETLAGDNAMTGGILPDVDPLPLIGALDELLIAAIDAAEEADGQQQVQQ